MPRVAAPVLALSLGLASAVALAACGGGSDAKLLPGTTAQEISENLDSVQRLVDEEQCVDAEDAALSVSTQVEAVEGIDPELKQALQKGAERLNEVVDRCEEAATVEETLPPPTETPEKAKAEEESEKAQEKAEKEAEKEEEKAAKEAEKEQKDAEKEAEKEQKEAEKEAEHEEAGGEPSGGIGPAGEAGEGD